MHTVHVNGLACKDPGAVVADDFYFAGLDKPGDRANSLGFAATLVQVPGLNTLGLAQLRFDFAPVGLNPPHAHPRASEILTVLEGSLYVGFVTSMLGNKGDVFVFPQGRVHFQYNNGSAAAAAVAVLSSQNPGLVVAAPALFRSAPAVPDDVLAKALQVDKKIVDAIKAQFQR